MSQQTMKVAVHNYVAKLHCHTSMTSRMYTLKSQLAFIYSYNNAIYHITENLTCTTTANEVIYRSIYTRLVHPNVACTTLDPLIINYV